MKKILEAIAGRREGIRNPGPLPVRSWSEARLPSCPWIGAQRKGNFFSKQVAVWARWLFSVCEASGRRGALSYRYMLGIGYL